MEIVARKTRLYKSLTKGFKVVTGIKADGECPNNTATLSFKRINADRPPYNQWNLLVHVIFKNNSSDRKFSTSFIKAESMYVTDDKAWRWNMLYGAGTVSDYEELIPILKQIEQQIKRNLLELELKGEV